eukprot:5735668-Prymnesium_polylepis.1
MSAQEAVRACAAVFSCVSGCTLLCQTLYERMLCRCLYRGCVGWAQTGADRHDDDRLLARVNGAVGHLNGGSYFDIRGRN